jgi:hypothetical protein
MAEKSLDSGVGRVHKGNQTTREQWCDSGKILERLIVIRHF